MNTAENKMTIIESLVKIYPFVNEKAIKSAIPFIEKSLKEPNESSAQQDLLDLAHDELDSMLVHDFSGKVTNNPNDVVQIVKNAFVFDNFAVEINFVQGGTEFIYISPEDALTFLNVALKNIDKQVANFSDSVAETKERKTIKSRQYKSIYADIVEAFNDQVVLMLGEVDNKELSLNESTVEGEVFADKMTDAMFFAWSCNYNHDLVFEGCVYDYLASGDKGLLNVFPKEISKSLVTRKKPRM